jgi:cysteine desulfurase
MSERIYLDWNATAPLRPSARAAMVAALEATGNASSVHREGRTARRLVEDARAQVAALIGAAPRNAVFTSGGTEANMLALTPALQPGADSAVRDRLFVSAVEHPSVLAGGRFAKADMEIVPVTGDGVVDLDALRRQLAQAAVRGTKRPLVSIMAANNETGVVQPVNAVAELAHAAGGLLHVDAVQAVGRMAFDINEMGADLVSISAHKIGGPQGIGALIRRDERLHLADPLIKGGGQERGLRAGTENVAAIAGFGAAAAETAAGRSVESERVSRLRDRLEAKLRALAAETVIFGAAAERVPNTVLLAVPGVKAETALIALDLDGVAVSSGSACSSGKVAASHVLAAMGVAPELARGAIRLSLGYSSTEADVEGFLQAWRKRLEPLAKARGIAA